MTYQEAKEELLGYFEAYKDVPRYGAPAIALTAFIAAFTLPAAFYNIVTKPL